MNAETYRAAAEEHAAVAAQLYRLRRWVLCHYVSGLAVECLLRAYRYRRDPEFDARHDVEVLCRASGIREAIPTSFLAAANDVLDKVAYLWSNSRRFRSAADLRAFLRRANAHRGIKGDFLKECSRRILAAATTFVEIGLDAWNRS